MIESKPFHLCEKSRLNVPDAISTKFPFDRQGFAIVGKPKDQFNSLEIETKSVFNVLKAEQVEFIIECMVGHFIVNDFLRSCVQKVY
jgi:hypothetical protein